jgi:dTDP-4-dehydrorhamnose reductase
VDNTKKKVLLLGSKGMLGQYVRAVFALDYDVVATDRKIIDITDVDSIIKGVEEIQPDIIINCAAFNEVDKIERDQELFRIARLVNGKAVEHLSKVCAQKDIIFAHFSTDYVFDGTDTDGYTEEHSPMPVNNYGYSKMEGEQHVKNNLQKYYLIRVSRLFGDKGSSHSVKESFVDKMLHLASKHDELSVINDEYSSPSYCLDIAHQLKYMLDNQVPFGIYHITNEGACNWYEFCVEIFNHVPHNIVINPVGRDHFPRQSQRPRYSALKNSKLPAMRNWDEAVKDYVKNHKQS